MAIPSLINARGDGRLVEHEVPGHERAARRFGRRVGRRQIVQQWHELTRRDGQVIGLQTHHVGDRQLPTGAEHFGDPRPAIWIRPDKPHRVHVRIPERDQIVVRRHDESLGGIERVRLLGDREIAGPLVATIARHGDESAPVRANRRDADGLPADVSRAVCPHHVLARDEAEAARVTKLLPRRRLIHAQAREVGRRSRLEPGRAHRVRDVMRRVLVHHRSVPRVLELHRHAGRPLHRNRLAHDVHRFPAAAIPILMRVCGIGPVDVEILAVRREDGESPRAARVVPDRDARHCRFASARRDEVNPVAQ